MFDSLSSDLFLPHVTEATRMKDPSKTLIDNISPNTLIEDVISGNSTAIISDHLPQFIILPNIFSNPPFNKSNISKRYCANFIQENYILDYLFVDWNSIISNDNKDVNFSFNSFFKENQCILDNHTPLRKDTQKSKI